MNKLKNVFTRSQKLKPAEVSRRPQQFVNRHSMVTPVATPSTSNDSTQAPTIDLSDLNEMEKPAYESWWKDLDPFDLGKINNQTVLKFLNGCSLEDSKLEQILTLFETAGDGLNKFQFFAMLRLIAHAQNGRKISLALVYLGAPVPQFHTNAIDALIKTDIPQRSLGNSPKRGEQVDTPTAQQHRKSWWGNEKEQMVNNRLSYLGPFTAHTPIPSAGDTNPVDYFYSHGNDSNNTTPTPFNTFSPNAVHSPWPQQDNTNHDSILSNTTTMRPILPNSNHTTTEIMQEKHSQHTRSKSAGTATDFLQTFHNPYQSPPPPSEPEETLPSSRSSLSLHTMNTGQSLLLTQKFVYQSPSVRKEELPSSNPFYIDTTPPAREVIVSPFGDENNSEESDTLSENEIIIHGNDKPNSYNLPPPPVPSQSNKPAFPKYTRTNTFLIKRSQSTVASKSHTSHRHTRNKSTSAAVFY